jgi:hypothetical protein
VASITSVAFTSTVTGLPDSGPRSVTASAVIAAVMVSPDASVTFTEVMASPTRTSLTTPLSWLRVLSFMVPSLD